MVCGVNEASQCYFLLAGCVTFLRIKRMASLYSMKKTGDGWKCTVQSAEKFAIHEVHKYVNG
jgi:hypothetical protein